MLAESRTLVRDYSGDKRVKNHLGNVVALERPAGFDVLTGLHDWCQLDLTGHGSPSHKGLRAGEQPELSPQAFTIGAR